MLSKSGHHKGIIRLVKPNYSAAIGFQSLTLCICYTILPNADIDKVEGTMNAAGSTMEAPIYRKVMCNGNNYGVADKTYGLRLSPCKDCPLHTYTMVPLTVPVPQKCKNMQTLYRNGDAGGFFDPQACCTLPGWGFDGVQAAICAKGGRTA
jgi:hypothetical protein